MFNHKQLALDGMYPGLQQTFQIALRGEFDTEVIIEPVAPLPGGGWAPANKGTLAKHFRVTVRVKFNGKWYQDSQIVDEYKARVIAYLRGIHIFSQDDTTVSINGKQVTEQKLIEVVVNRIDVIKSSMIKVTAYQANK